MMKGGTTRRMRVDDMKTKFDILTSFPDQPESVVTTNVERSETSSLDIEYWTLDIGYWIFLPLPDGGWWSESGMLEWWNSGALWPRLDLARRQA